jgi:hypothetical protein
LLRLYVGYRLLLSVLFFSLVQLQWAPNYMGSDDHQLFSLTIFLYTAINILTPVAFYLWHWKPGETAIFAMLLIDAVAQSLFAWIINLGTQGKFRCKNANILAPITLRI